MKPARNICRLIHCCHASVFVVYCALSLSLITTTEALNSVWCMGKELKTDTKMASLLCDPRSEIAIINSTCQLFCPEYYDPETRFFKCNTFGWFPMAQPKCEQNSSITMMIVPALLGSLVALFIISLSIAMYKRRRRKRRLRQERGDDAEQGRKKGKRQHYLKTNPALRRDICEVREKTERGDGRAKEERAPDNFTTDKYHKRRDMMVRSVSAFARGKRIFTTKRRRKAAPPARKSGGGGPSMWNRLKQTTRRARLVGNLKGIRGKSVRNWRRKLGFQGEARMEVVEEETTASKHHRQSQSSSDSYTDCSDDSSSEEYTSSEEEEEAAKKIAVQIETAPTTTSDPITTPLSAVNLVHPLTEDQFKQKEIIDKILVESLISKSPPPLPPPDNKLTAADEEYAKVDLALKHRNRQRNPSRGVVGGGGEKQRQNPYEHYPTSGYDRQYLDFGKDYRRTEHYFDGSNYQVAMNTVQYYPIEPSSKKTKQNKEAKKTGGKGGKGTTGEAQARHGVKYFSIRPSSNDLKHEREKGPSRYAPRDPEAAKKRRIKDSKKREVDRHTRSGRPVKDKHQRQRSSARRSRSEGKSKKKAKDGEGRRRKRTEEEEDYSSYSSSPSPKRKSDRKRRDGGRDGRGRSNKAYEKEGEKRRRGGGGGDAKKARGGRRERDEEDEKRRRRRKMEKRRDGR